MADNAVIRYAGDWIFHNGAVAAGALLTVYNAGTLDLASIFTDNDLTVASANPVTADASGLMPFVWVDTREYKVRLTTSTGTLIDEQDNISGAFDSTPFLAGAFAKPDQDFTNKTGAYTVVEADLGTIINGDCSGGAFDFTMLSAVTATNGKGVTLRHVGTAGTIGIVTVSSQTITSPTTGVTTQSFELIGYGESVTLVSDGSNWHVTNYVPPLMRPNTPGIILIADRVTSAPASSPGTRYIVSTGFSTFETHDIIEDNGQGGFIEITPPTDCGWVAYVRDEDLYYRFIGSAWVAESATDTVRGTAEIATQAEMETATDTGRIVTPGRQHFHPGMPKAVVRADETGAIIYGYNIASVVRNSTGNFTVTMSVTLANTNYAVVGGVMHAGAGAVVRVFVSPASGSVFNVIFQDSGGGADDPDDFAFAIYGDI